MSIIKRLVLIYLTATVLMLGLITVLIYPALKEISIVAPGNILANLCIRNLFIGLWAAAGISIVACYIISKHSLSPLNKLSKTLNSINVLSLDARLCVNQYPKELKQLATTCNELLSRIEVSFNQLTQFSAGIAHELRNPMHMLKTTTEITLATPQGKEAYTALLEQHLEEFNHLNQLIEKLLLLSRSEHKLLDLSCEHYSAKELIHSVTQFYAIEAEERGVSISCIEDARIFVDRALFRQVLSNLVDNSLRHTPPGGKITAYISETADHVNITLSDTGSGIPQDELPYITQGFYRPNSETSEKQNLGLGLAIAKSIVQCHSGRLMITSADSVGTKINIELPKNP